MLPMIAVSGTRSTRRYNSLWDRAAAPSQWWQNPTLSFGAGYPQWVPPHANPMRARAGVGVRRRATRAGGGVRQSECMKKCLSYKKWSKKRCGELCGETITAPPSERGGCYKSGGACKGGFRKVGYDKDGSAICCPGRAGPMVLNAALRAPPGVPTHEACRLVCAHLKGIKFHKCYQECMQPILSRPGDGRRGRVRSSARRRTQVRALARAARSMVSVGHAGAACCESCAKGGQCEGGCGANCTCGKESTVRRGGVTYSPTPNPSTVAIGDVVFSPPTTSRLLNRARHRAARR